MLRNNSIHRITDFGLLKFINTTLTTDYFKVNSTSTPQYVLNADVQKTVWVDGTYKHRLNKIYSNLALYTPAVGNDPVSTLNYDEVHFMLKQNYDWDLVFGLLIIIKDIDTGIVLVSKMCTIDYFSITNDKLLIDGSFWMEECILKIPNANDNLVCQISEILYTEINDETGSLYEFPTSFETLTEVKPLPDYLTISAVLDDDFYLNLTPTTTENKTIEQSLLDNFGLTNAVITIEHVITYGTETLGYKELRVSNESNNYSNVKVGLDMSDYLNTIVTIYVSTEIKVDSKLLTREATLTTDLTTLNPLIAAKITHPTTNYPVTVTKTSSINKTIIEAKNNTKVVSVYQTIIAQFINDTFIFESKNIVFDKLTEPTYLKLIATTTDNSQTQLSKLSSDGKYYFDLSEFTPITTETTYQLISAVSLKIVGTGLVSLPT